MVFTIIDNDGWISIRVLDVIISESFGDLIVDKDLRSTFPVKEVFQKFIVLWLLEKVLIFQNIRENMRIAVDTSTVASFGILNDSAVT
mgnify:CR=1 FL=1